MIFTPDEKKQSKFITYTFNDTNFAISYELIDNCLTFSLKKENSLTTFESKIQFEKIKQEHLDRVKWFYNTAEEFIQAFKEIIDLKELTLEENNEFIELTFEEIVARRKVKISIKVERITKEIEPKMQVVMFEELMIRLCLLEKKNMELVKVTDNVVAENLMLKEKCVSLEKEVAKIDSMKNEYDNKINNLLQLTDTKINDAIYNYTQDKQKRKNDLLELKLKLIDKVIPRSDYEFINECMPSEFKGFKPTLIYKATLDGFGASHFHSKVDGISNILFIGTTEQGNRFGGFSNNPFTSSNKFKKDPFLKTFIFSLDKKVKCSLKLKDNAIYDGTGYGPTFGSSHTIYICDNSNVNAGSSSTPHSGYDIK